MRRRAAGIGAVNSPQPPFAPGAAAERALALATTVRLVTHGPYQSFVEVAANVCLNPGPHASEKSILLECGRDLCN